MSIYLTEPNLFPGLKDMPEEYPESERMESGAYRIGNPDADDIMDKPLRDARRQWEREYFQHQIEIFHGNITRIAKFCGMDRAALHRKMKNLPRVCTVALWHQTCMHFLYFCEREPLPCIVCFCGGTMISLRALLCASSKNLQQHFY